MDWELDMADSILKQRIDIALRELEHERALYVHLAHEGPLTLTSPPMRKLAAHLARYAITDDQRVELLATFYQQLALVRADTYVHIDERFKLALVEDDHATPASGAATEAGDADRDAAMKAQMEFMNGL